MDEELPHEFRMEVVGDGDLRTVRLYGELDLVSADDLEAALVAQGTPAREVGTDHGSGDAGDGNGPTGGDGVPADTRPRTVVADLSNLEFIDSTGLSALLVARHRIALVGSVLQIRGAGGAARRVFEAAGLEDVLDD